MNMRGHMKILNRFHLIINSSSPLTCGLEF
jgi:hypothetical protein